MRNDPTCHPSLGQNRFIFEAYRKQNREVGQHERISCLENSTDLLVVVMHARTQAGYGIG